MKEKVTVLTPCYNVERYIGRFLESIINQDYRPIELILVNDGSTDNTDNIIRSFLYKLEKAEIEFKYFQKENEGQASAIAYGLPHVTGEFLTWPDSDDFLLEHTDCKLVRSNGYVYKEGEYSEKLREISKIKRITTLMDFVKFEVSWIPGCYMVRMDAFDEMNPHRYIYNSSIGQNIQMIFPIVSKYPCEYLDEYLFGYLVRKNSHSRSINSYDKHIQRIFEERKCVEKTLEIISSDTSEYMKQHIKFSKMCLLRTAWIYGNKKDIKRFSDDIIHQNKKSISVLFMRVIPYNRISKFVLRCIQYIERRL